MTRYLYLVLAVAGLLCGSCATAQRGAIDLAYSAIKDGRYDSALTRLSDAEKYTPPSPALQAEIAFLRARSYEGLKRLPEAIGSYRYVAEKFPESIYAFQATERLKELDQKEPKALVPTPMSVTPAADASVAPDAGAAHF